MGRIKRRIWNFLFGKRWLFVDDHRDPPENLSMVFDTVRDFDGLKEWVEVNGIPNLVSFDHDLHAEHTSFFYENGGWGSPPDPDQGCFVNPTGYELAEWLLRESVERGVHPRYMMVHSRNPLGSDRILSLLTAHTESHKTGSLCRKIRWGQTPRK